MKLTLQTGRSFREIRETVGHDANWCIMPLTVFLSSL
jgi:hypothetical protein